MSPGGESTSFSTNPNPPLTALQSRIRVEVYVDGLRPRRPAFGDRAHSTMQSFHLREVGSAVQATVEVFLVALLCFSGIKATHSGYQL